MGKVIYIHSGARLDTPDPDPTPAEPVIHRSDRVRVKATNVHGLAYGRDSTGKVQVYHPGGPLRAYEPHELEVIKK